MFLKKLKILNKIKIVNDYKNVHVNEKIRIYNEYIPHGYVLFIEKHCIEFIVQYIFDNCVVKNIGKEILFGLEELQYYDLAFGFKTRKFDY